MRFLERDFLPLRITSVSGIATPPSFASLDAFIGAHTTITAVRRSQLRTLLEKEEIHPQTLLNDDARADYFLMLHESGLPRGVINSSRQVVDDALKAIHGVYFFFSTHSAVYLSSYLLALRSQIISCCRWIWF